MDAITDFAFNVDNEMLTSISLMLNNDVIFFFMVIAMVFVAEKRNSKRIKIFSVFLLATVFSFVIKSFLAIERPCASMNLDYCPPDYSFPSMHAVITFALMISFLNKKNYWVFMLFALFVSFTRMVIAVHSFRDIAGALPVALITYYIVDVLWRHYHGKGRS